MLKIYSILIFLIIGEILESYCEKLQYKNFQVFNIKPISEKHIQNLKTLENEERSYIILDQHFLPGKNNNVIVSPNNVEELKKLLSRYQIPYQLLHTNVQAALNDLNGTFQRSNIQKDYNWLSYHTLDETYSWLRNLSRIHSTKVELLYGGSTYERRDILGVKLSHKNGNKGILIEGGIHAREWISPATVTYILNELLQSNDPEIKYIAENFDWYFFPHTNPDGYVYTHTTDRFWRKTRSRLANSRCIGVDPNRNWDIHWNEKGTSTNPCSDSYAGSKPFSEIETKSFSEFLKTLNGKINAYISFHSYSQLLLFPYGYTDKLAPNHEDLKQIGTVTINALSKRHGTKYKTGNIYDTIYPASGSSIEWMYDNENVKLSYCYELRPDSNSGGWKGFQLPSNQIIPTGEEILDSLIAFLKQGQKLNYF